MAYSIGTKLDSGPASLKEHMTQHSRPTTDHMTELDKLVLVYIVLDVDKLCVQACNACLKDCTCRFHRETVCHMTTERDILMVVNLLFCNHLFGPLHVYHLM